MRLSARLLLSLLFIILFAPALILGSLKFQLLNYDFLTASFNKNKAYDQVPGFLETTLKEQETKGKLGIPQEPGSKNASENIPLSSFVKSQSEQYFQQAKGAASYVLYAWLGVLALLALIIFGLYKLGGQKKVKGMGVLLTVTGIVFFLLSGTINFFLIQITRELSVTTEPSQRLITIAASSFLPEIARTWLLVSITVFAVGILLLLNPKLKHP